MKTVVAVVEQTLHPDSRDKHPASDLDGRDFAAPDGQVGLVPADP